MLLMPCSFLTWVRFMEWEISLAIVLCLLMAGGVFLNKTKTQTASHATQSSADKAMSTYLGLRNLALSIASTEKERPSKNPDEPRAVLMDIALTHRTATIVAYADGTASIYISNGGGFLGGGQKYASIREGAHKMLATAHQLQPKMQATKQFPLPEKGDVFFYLVTASEVYTARAPRSELDIRTHAFTELYAAGQEIITQYRLLYTPKP